MTLRQIQYIVEVERFGSLSNAAKALFISQSTLSFAIKDLETELGFPIFERTRSGMLPTELGREYLNKAHTALAAFRELENQLPRSDSRCTTLRLASVQSSILSSAIYDFLPEYEESSTPLRLNYYGGSTGEVVDTVSANECDLGFIYATDRQMASWKTEFQSRGIDFRILSVVDVAVILSENDPKASNETVSLSELSGYTYVFAGDDGLTGFSNLADYSALNFNLNEHHHYLNVQDTQLVNILLHSENRFSIGHKCSFDLYGRGLVYIPLKDRRTVNLLALYRENRPLPKEAEQLLETVRKKAEQFR